MAATILDSNFKSSGFALSGGNLVATSSAAATAGGSRSSTGKHYAEFSITTLTGTPACGIVNNTYTMNTQLMGADSNAVGYRSNGAVVLNNATLATIAAYVAGDRIDMAFDPNDRLIWFRVNGGNWNNSGTANPATGAEGIDISGLTRWSRLLPAVNASATGTVWTCKFSTAFTGAVPSGFSSFDNVLITIANAPIKQASLFTPDFDDAIANCSKFYANRGFSPAGPITVVSGEVQENAVPIGGKRVDVYDRNTGELIGFDISAGDGTWSVAALGRPSVRIVGSDPTAFNSLVYDNVIPL